MARKRKSASDREESSSREQPRPARGKPRDDAPVPTTLRIIGGTFRGRKLLYSGELRTRPMKDRLREAVFNLLGTDPRGRCAVDLFAGTGALGLEALSRGAAAGVFFERHFPSADIVQQNIASLGVEASCRVVPASTFIQFRDVANSQAAVNDDRPWLVFVSPPYDFYVDRRDEMLKLLATVTEAAPSGSVLVAETDGRFDFNELPDAAEWAVRDYPPARIGIRHV